jgi:hypothetical protein
MFTPDHGRAAKTRSRSYADRSSVTGDATSRGKLGCSATAQLQKLLLDNLLGLWFET